MKKSAWFVALLLALVAVPAFAQQGPGGGGGGNGGPGGPGGGPPDFTEMRKHMEEEMKQDMDVTDDQWKSLQPKIEKVQALQESLGGHHGPPHGGPDGPDNDQDPTPVQQATNDLEDVLDNNNATDAEIKAKIAAVRKAKDAAKKEMVKAQEDLKDGLTARQEAVLVAHGLLD